MSFKCNQKRLAMFKTLLTKTNKRVIKKNDKNIYDYVSLFVLCETES